MPNSSTQIGVLHEICESTDYTDAWTALCSTLEIDARRMDEITNSMQWMLARNPLFYPSLDDGLTYVAKIRSGAGHPALYILYSYDLQAEVCELLHIYF